MRISDWSSDVCSSDLWIVGVLLLGLRDPKRAVLGVNVADSQGRELAPTDARAAAGDDEGLPIVRGGIDDRPELGMRSEERRVGKECGSTCRSRRWPLH